MSSIALFFLVLVLIGASAFVTALIVARLARRRAERASRRGRQRRSWGGRDYDRMRTKYFDKERRARSARERTRFRDQVVDEPEPSRDEVQPSKGDAEYHHRATLDLVGVELTAEVLREAYRQRVREYHPDRVALLGVKLRVLAEEETKRINEAYKYLRRRYDL